MCQKPGSVKITNGLDVIASTQKTRTKDRLSHSAVTVIRHAACTSNVSLIKEVGSTLGYIQWRTREKHSLCSRMWVLKFRPLSDISHPPIIGRENSAAFSHLLRGRGGTVHKLYAQSNCKWMLISYKKSSSCTHVPAAAKQLTNITNTCSLWLDNNCLCVSMWVVVRSIILQPKMPLLQWSVLRPFTVLMLQFFHIKAKSSHLSSLRWIFLKSRFIRTCSGLNFPEVILALKSWTGLTPNRIGFPLKSIFNVFNFSFWSLCSNVGSSFWKTQLVLVYVEE